MKTISFPALATALVVMISPIAARAETRALGGHLPEAVTHLHPLARMAPAQTLDLCIGLRLRNTNLLNATLQSQYDPASPGYRKWLTPQQFAEQFGPTDEDYQKALDFAQANGFKVTAKYASRRLVEVTAHVSDVEQAFHVHILKYQHPTESRQFYAPDTEPTLDAAVPILSVGNLNNYILPHPNIRPSRPFTPVPTGGQTPDGSPEPFLHGSAPDGSGTYFGADFRKAYLGANYNVQGNLGAGQTVGILEFNQTINPVDFTNYITNAGISTTERTVYLNNAVTNGFGTDNGEASLDVEVAVAMAPKATVIVFDGQQTDTILDAMVMSNNILQFSASWGYGVDATSDTYFTQMAAQGQSYLNSSGDSDSQPTSRLGIGYAPADPNVTVVGGTALLTDANLNYVSESVWNDDTPNGTNIPPTAYWGSTGGVTQYAIPSWQVPIIGATYTNRTTPDVALTAENIFIYFNNGNEGYEGGTSCASPLWAGFVALVNAQAAAAGQPNAGFLNPTLYHLDTTHGDPIYTYSQLFHDVTMGSNAWLEMPTNYFATTGYDLCTGLGTPTSNLLSSISGTDNTIWVHQSGPSGNSGSFAYPLSTLSAGVTAVPSSGTIVLLNGSASPGAISFTKPMKLIAVGGKSTIGP